ncbi:hypothetical protein E4U42_002925 [Claviceps africana]|uniref:Uncharacterized protein n=1 Tax=Claviceps africana TaxID=83212 RepID=A0A8K0NJE8_9HYPO|nr:hypothetical protein E4U42_002925 [Claviceps africana]
MDAGTSMAHVPFTQDDPVSSSSLVDTNDELYPEIFDWEWQWNCQELDVEPSHFPCRQTPPPQTPSELKTHLSPTSPTSSTSLDLDNLAMNHFLSDRARMSTQFPLDDDTATTSDYLGHSPPGLIDEGGNTPPSDHSGSIFLDHAEERTIPDNVALHQVQEHQDEEWTYPQTVADPAKAPPQAYAPHIVVREAYADLHAAQSAGTKRRRSNKDIDKRPRQLVDPLQTADVRKSGACVPCRVTKTRVRHHHHASLHK